MDVLTDSAPENNELFAKPKPFRKNANISSIAPAWTSRTKVPKKNSLHQHLDAALLPNVRQTETTVSCTKI